MKKIGIKSSIDFFKASARFINEQISLDLRAEKYPADLPACPVGSRNLIAEPKWHGNLTGYLSTVI
jgi:hypothetical protein